MKAILKFDLNDRDDRMAHLRAVKSMDMACALFEISCNLRKNVERRLENDPHVLRDEFDGIDEVFMDINRILMEHGLDIDELIL
jgi:hypothetical protein